MSGLTRQTEQEKYRAIYKTLTPDDYVCKGQRLPNTQRDLESLPCRGSYFDLGCGAGQMMNYAASIGFTPVFGMDLVKGSILGEAHVLPVKTKSIDVAVMFDVIEHLVPPDDELACRELARIARNHVLVSANNRDSHRCGWQLHINKRDYGEWERLFKQWMGGKVSMMPGRHTSPMWRVDL